MLVTQDPEPTSGVHLRRDGGDQFRPTAAYVDRMLKGEKPRDLPVQATTKYELAINIKNAKAIGRTVPPSLPLVPTIGQNLRCLEQGAANATRQCTSVAKVRKGVKNGL
jgi:hypothetical protein